MIADMVGHCPVCEAEVDYKRWGDDFPCPECGTQLQHSHDCEKEDCYDYLIEVAT